ncbi:MAG: hydroxymethylpyrimidine/phosphomethylpyrimidine kinase, partial [Candidatus Eremiobacteraeota bacterium]|nr:hydroxymethylpyrimidine/phosphomethylpyrimidine kinase [Candidatus Eremiobacteraeota bacterium]
ADALAAAGGVEIFEDDRFASGMRGTGCVLAMALASELARGALLRDAVVLARQFVRNKIKHAREFQGLRVPY